jgi:ABC-type glycerol-3-phosphate transport system permease component
MFFLGEAWLDLGMLASGLMVSVLPVIILYLILSEQFIKGMTAGAIKG